MVIVILGFRARGAEFANETGVQSIFESMRHFIFIHGQGETL